MLGRVRVPPRSPTSLLLRGPPTSSFPSASAPVSPCLWPTSVWTLVLCGATCVASAGRARIRWHTSRRRVITGSPLHRYCTEEERGSPRCLDRPLTLRGGPDAQGPELPTGSLGERWGWSYTPPDAAPPRPFAKKPPSPSGSPTPSASGKNIVFVAAFPTAHVLARLRIAGSVTATVARLATGAPPLRAPSCRQAAWVSGGVGRAHPSPGGDRTRWTTIEVSWIHFIVHSVSASQSRVATG